MSDIKGPGPFQPNAIIVKRSRPLWRIMLRQQLAVVAAGFLVAVIVLLLLAPVLPLFPPNEIHSRDYLLPPGVKGYLLGTDSLGRDVLSRLIWGGRVSLPVGFFASGIALLIGVSLGLISGLYGGRIDSVIMRLTDMVLAFPVILLAIAIVAALGPGLSNAMIASAIASYPLYTRVARASVLSTREMDFVTAARMVGANNGRIMLKHLLPNILAPLLVTFTLDIGEKIILTSSLSFLGLGTQPPTADWGNMIATGRSMMRSAPHLVLVPGTAMFLVVMAFNIVGDGLRDATDPRLRNI